MDRPKTSIWLVCIVAAAGMAAGQTRDAFRIDAGSSDLVVHVGRAGLFSFAGHDHEIVVPALDGRIEFDAADVSRSSVMVDFDATKMMVTGRGEPAEDVPEVQRVMLSDRVLDVARHPRITFVSRRVTMGAVSESRMRLQIEGQLTLRGVMQPITVPVDLQVSPDSLLAKGTATVRQSRFGITPVTAGAGTVRVKDDVEVVFTIAARRD